MVWGISLLISNLLQHLAKTFIVIVLAIQTCYNQIKLTTIKEVYHGYLTSSY